MMVAALMTLVSIGCGNKPASGRDAVETSRISGGNGPAAAKRCQSEWRELEPGLSYRTADCNEDRVGLHLVRIDPRQWQIDAAMSEGETAESVAARLEVPFAINTNFFDEKGKAIGLVISSGRELHRLQPVSWESIFYVDESNRSGIVLPESWPGVRVRAATAVQVGPRIIASGKLTGAKAAEPSLRSGVCLTADREIVFFATSGDVLYRVDEITRLLTRTLKCRDAMLFDGGPSAQLFLRAGGFEVAMDGDNVPVFLIARRR